MNQMGNKGFTHKPGYIKRRGSIFDDRPYSSFESYVIDNQDVNQEAELMKLEGKTPHRGIIKKRLVHDSSSMLTFFHRLPATARPIQTEVEPLSEEDYIFLVEYLHSLPISTTTVTEFLENPEDEDKLDLLLQELYNIGVLTSKDWKDSKIKKKSLKIIILEKIRERGEMSLEELFQFGSSIHVSKRPTQAVRISLRRLLQSKDIIEKDGIYSAT